MGLIERRLVKLGKEEWVPAAEKELQSITASSCTIDVDWPSFENDEAALKNLQNQCLGRILNALRVVCRDELGKEAARDQIKKVVVQNISNAAEKGVSLDGGVLKVQGVYSKGSEGYLSDLDLTRFVERAL